MLLNISWVPGTQKKQAKVTKGNNVLCTTLNVLR